MNWISELIRTQVNLIKNNLLVLLVLISINLLLKPAYNQEPTMFVVNTPEDKSINISINSTLCVKKLNGLYHIWIEKVNKVLASYDDKEEAEENLRDINKAIASGKRGWDLKNRKDI